jgi:alkanesulfonate monooxygenase SsuD/methylene tetrahydromethanopterin reductase-like flavin-dependent oxidoreductase (luciferase family)
LTQPPHLLLAGSGPRLLALAAKAADTVTLTWPPTATPADVTPIVDRFRSVAGDRADSIELNLNVMAVGDAPAPGIERFIGMSTAELAKLGAVSVLPGDAARNARTLLEWRDRWGFSYVTVNVDFMHEFAPVVERLRD